MEGQQVAPIVLELGVDTQHAIIILQVAQVKGELLLRAVDLAEVQEGRQGIDLLPFVGHATKVVGCISGPADWGGPEGWDAAFVATGGEPAVVRWNLDGARQNLVSICVILKIYILLLFFNEKLSLCCRKITLFGYDLYIWMTLEQDRTAHYSPL